MVSGGRRRNAAAGVESNQDTWAFGRGDGDRDKFQFTGRPRFVGRAGGAISRTFVGRPRAATALSARDGEPEAPPGARDSHDLFRRFIDLIAVSKKGSPQAA